LKLNVCEIGLSFNELKKVYNITKSNLLRIEIKVKYLILFYDENLLNSSLSFFIVIILEIIYVFTNFIFLLFDIVRFY